MQHAWLIQRPYTYGFCAMLPSTATPFVDRSGLWIIGCHKGAATVQASILQHWQVVAFVPCRPRPQVCWWNEGGSGFSDATKKHRYDANIDPSSVGRSPSAEMAFSSTDMSLEGTAITQNIDPSSIGKSRHRQREGCYLLTDGMHRIAVVLPSWMACRTRRTDSSINSTAKA